MRHLLRFRAAVLACRAHTASSYASATVARRPLVGLQDGHRPCLSLSTSTEANNSDTTGPLSPTEVYTERVSASELSTDKHQLNVLKHLDRLQNEVQQMGGTAGIGAWPATFFGLFGSDTKTPNTPQGVYIWGTVGGGKTMLMDMFYENAQVYEDKKARMHYHDFMLEVHRLLHEAKKMAPPRDISRWDTYQPFDPIPPVGKDLLSRIQLLCLDEFQVTDIADAMILRQLFAYLFDHGLVLVATSNRPPDDLYKKGLQRSNFVPFIALLKQKSEVVSLDPGVDYRRKAMAGAEKLFFVTTDPESNADDSLNTLFKIMSSKETDSVRPRSIRIKGRDISFSKTCGGVCDCDFEELCGRPLWTNDYLKMSQVFHTVFIRNIPVMTSHRHRSEARRFITLIDTFYDNKIRVIASGAAPYWDLFQAEEVSEQQKLEENRMLIDDLGIKANEEGSLASGVFTGEEELFAFDRTVSRLTEMQTKDYWKKWKSHGVIAT